MQNQVQRLEKFLAQDKYNKHILADLIGLCCTTKNLDKAKHYLKQLEDLDIEAARYPHALLAIQQGDYAIAIDHLKTLLQQSSDTLNIAYHLAFCYLQVGKVSNAQTLLDNNLSKETIVLYPEYLLLASRVAHHLQQLTKAIAHCQYYLTLKPDSIAGLSQMALLFLDNHENEKADNYAKKCLSLCPNYYQAEEVLLFLNLQEQNITPKQAKILVDRQNNSGRAHLAYGQALMLDFKLEEAIIALTKASQLMPTFIGGYLQLAWCYLLVNNLTKAKSCFEKASQLNKNFAESHGGLAIIAALDGYSDKAQKLKRKALRLNAESFTAKVAGILLISNPQKANQAFEQLMNEVNSLFNHNLIDLLTKRLAVLKQRHYH